MQIGEGGPKSLENAREEFSMQHVPLAIAGAEFAHVFGIVVSERVEQFQSRRMGVKTGGRQLGESTRFRIQSKEFTHGLQKWR